MKDAIHGEKKALQKRLIVKDTTNDDISVIFLSLPTWKNSNSFVVILSSSSVRKDATLYASYLLTKIATILTSS